MALHARALAAVQNLIIIIDYTARARRTRARARAVSATPESRRQIRQKG